MKKRVVTITYEVPDDTTDNMMHEVEWDMFTQLEIFNDEFNVDVENPSIVAVTEGSHPAGMKGSR